jgi:hypothetical protein
MNTVKLKNGAIWPDPTDGCLSESLYEAIHNKEKIRDITICRLVKAAQAYKQLIDHPAMTLKEVQKTVSGIRKAIKTDDPTVFKSGSGNALLE